MTHSLRHLPFLAVLLTFSALYGCGENSGPPPVAVSGTVTLDGKPLPEGFLYFKTIATGALERFDIANGQFSGKAQAGKRRVEIYANRPKTIEIDGKNVEVPENIIHPSFNTESKLSAEVSAEGPNQFQFDVQKK